LRGGSPESAATTTIDSMSAAERKVLTAKSPGDVLAVVPYRVGFHPSESLVVVEVSGPRRRLGFSVRVDLPDEAHTPAVADQVSRALGQNPVAQVLVVAYARRAETAQPLVEEMLRRFGDNGIEVLEALRADGERWFSYTCGQQCCPAEGTPYDNSCHPLTVAAVMEGEVVLPDRETLERSVAPVDGSAAVAMAKAVQRAEDALLDRLAREESRVPSAAILARLVEEIAGFVRGFLDQPRRLTDDEAGRLAVWVQFIPVRDTAWLLMTRADAATHLDLWRQVLRRVVPPHEPAVACLTAFAAWLQGNGALAGCAVRRALAAAPDYSLARLIDDTLRHAMPPSSWDEVAEGLERRICG
jgi:hypothetical protein